MDQQGKGIKVLSSAEEWPIWKLKCEDYLDYHEGALDVIEGRLTKPEPIDETSVSLGELAAYKKRCELYRKANSFVKQTLASTLSDEIYQKIMPSATAFDAWNALKRLFEATAGDQLIGVCMDFFGFVWSDAEDIATHIAKLKVLWRKLNSSLEKRGVTTLPDILLVCKTLHMLPSTFQSFLTSWMLLKQENEEQTLDTLATQLYAHERTLVKAQSKEDAQQALVATGSKPTTKKKKSKKSGACHYCHKKGHWVRECTKWISDGRPPRNSAGTDKGTCFEKENVSMVLFSGVESVAVAEVSSGVWWMDNGATKHISGDRSVFRTYRPFLESVVVHAAGTEVLTAEGSGTVELLTVCGTTVTNITLQDVWFVPKVTRNLFSILAALDSNPNSVFNSSATNCSIVTDGVVRLEGRRNPGGTLFRALCETVREAEAQVVDKPTSLLQLYHEKWGHQNKNHVKRRVQVEFGIKIPAEKETCESCIYGKSHRLPFGTRPLASTPGELIAVDVCGPFPYSFRGKRYLVLFKDVYSKYRYGYLLHQKSEVKDVLSMFLAQARTRGHTIKELISDNGGEFVCAGVRQILEKEGITHRLTAPYTPQQNGHCERDLRTVVEMTRTLMHSQKEVQFPSAMWAELAATALYILNRTGPSSVNDVSPHQLWFGEKPRLKHLKIIGTTSYAHVPGENRGKLDRKAKKCYLVGYDGDERYRLWLPEEKKVILSRDVQFLEGTYDCQAKEQNSQENGLQLPHQSLTERATDQGKQAVKSEDCMSDTENDATETISQEDKQITPLKQVNLGQRNLGYKGRLRDRTSLRRPKYYGSSSPEADFLVSEEELLFCTTSERTFDTPLSFEDAMESEEKHKWEKAMDSEFQSLKENDTWELTELPSGAKAIPCKWVFRTKKNPDGTIARYKARLVVKGFNQKKGIDYQETFSPVARLETVRAILSIAAVEHLHLRQFDVSTAFLYGHLQEAIYIEQPEGYHDGSNRVCKLKRSLYGLKQAPRCWSQRFGTFLQQLGFKASTADPCLFIRKENGSKIIIVLYVDDGLVAGSDEKEILRFLCTLQKEFRVTVGPVSYFLGLEVTQDKDGTITISQNAYICTILEKYGFGECKAVTTPILKETPRNRDQTSNQLVTFPYRQAIGSLMYLMTGSRPDLAYSVGILSRFLDAPSEENVVQVKRLFRYIQGTRCICLRYRPECVRGLEHYSDADFGGCNETGRSTTGGVHLYAGGAISWQSQRQGMVATSTTEAELIAASDATREVIWLKRLFGELTQLKDVPKLYVDNTAAVRLALNPEFHKRTKHINIKHFFVREQVQSGTFEIKQISTEHQLADIFTKPVSKTRLDYTRRELGLHSSNTR